ncbi:Uncharacterised protein [Segatella copri]|nr:Uncharacterised protein [Segatella copri]
MVGGAIFGYCSIGSDTKPIIPSKTKKMETTVESTGRFIKFVNDIIYYFSLYLIIYYFFPPIAVAKA